MTSLPSIDCIWTADWTGNDFRRSVLSGFCERTPFLTALKLVFDTNSPNSEEFTATGDFLVKDSRPVLLCLLVLAIGCADSRTNVSNSPSTGQDQVEVAKAESSADEAVGDSDAVTEVDEELIPLDQLPKTEKEWLTRLTPLQFEVTQEKGTERSFRNTYWDNHDDGLYRCVCCGAPLFDSTTKYESGTGWPSFWQPVSKSAVKEEPDNTLFTTRTEVLCKRCGAHLGHVFEDGPIDKTGLRYCMNSASLNFRPRKTDATHSDSGPADPEATSPAETAKDPADAE